MRAKLVLDVPLGRPCVVELCGGALVLRVQRPSLIPFLAVLTCYTCFHIEAFFAWAAISMDPHRTIRQEPLEDHVYNLIKGWNWLSTFGSINMQVNGGMQSVFVASFFLVAAAQKTYDTNSFVTSGFLKLGALRLLRATVFLCTTLPNPHAGCYLERFEKAEQDHGWWHMALLPGSYDLAKLGGCNDLLYSGHCTVSATIVAIVSQVPRFGRISAFLFFWLAGDALVRIQNRNHYSVDVWLAIIISALFVYATKLPATWQEQLQSPSRKRAESNHVAVACTSKGGREFSPRRLDFDEL
eukprot:SAG31_NODE_3160_length_4608_cov_1.972943_3_plen_298_part_00